MSAQGREWQPGDKALIEVEVTQPDLGGRLRVKFVESLTDHVSPRRLTVKPADLRPVPAGGEVEAATEDVIEQAAEVIWHGDHLERAVLADARTIARALAAAGLLAGGVPGRSVAEAVAASITTHNDTPVTAENLRWAATHEALCRSWIFDVLVGLADALDPAARVAGTTEAGDDRG